ncbi:hypothetical protein [Winogradskyella poriferorum]|uniref:hypothetical protein n=1 Tax=Winogradskyella poriferorum TaxID=307627 RepID=UPI003D646B7F
MIKFDERPYQFSAKLTAIWAVSESGLGGFLHAIRLPFSGLFLGSLAVIIITYLAYISPKKFDAIIKATLLVVLIKATASPHSPPMAYVAVLFQGLIGACIYAVFGVNRLSAMLFGAVALFESAFQKILTLTLFFGLGLWESFQKFFNELQDKFNSDWISELPWIFLFIYGLVYLLGGIIIGNLSIKLPKKVLDNAKSIKVSELTFDNTRKANSKRKRKRVYLFLSLLLFSVLVFVFTGAIDNALSIVLRTFGALVLFLFVINPLFKYFIQKWAKKEKDAQGDTLRGILKFMPSIKRNINAAYHLSLKENNTYKKLLAFTINWLSLSLYFSLNDNEQ